MARTLAIFFLSWQLQRQILRSNAQSTLSLSGCMSFTMGVAAHLCNKDLACGRFMGP